MSKAPTPFQSRLPSQAEIDMYVQRGRTERSKAFREAFRALIPSRKPVATKGKVGKAVSA
ncbi:MAG: hypothetical protein AAFO62_03070 [Pseudomonadota bacterium]